MQTEFKNAKSLVCCCAMTLNNSKLFQRSPDEITVKPYGNWDYYPVFNLLTVSAK